MKCPPEIADILLEILGAAILRIRLGSSERTFCEADHVHNLPSLIRDYSPERLRYYWEVERTTFLDHGATSQFEPLWERLREQMEATHSLNAIQDIIPSPPSPLRR
jgi:hypothetical protein